MFSFFTTIGSEIQNCSLDGSRQSRDSKCILQIIAKVALRMEEIDKIFLVGHFSWTIHAVYNWNWGRRNNISAQLSISVLHTVQRKEGCSYIGGEQERVVVTCCAAWGFTRSRMHLVCRWTREELLQPEPFSYRNESTCQEEIKIDYCI